MSNITLSEGLLNSFSPPLISSSAFDSQVIEAVRACAKCIEQYGQAPKNLKDKEAQLFSENARAKEFAIVEEWNRALEIEKELKATVDLFEQISQCYKLMAPFFKGSNNHGQLLQEYSAHPASLYKQMQDAIQSYEIQMAKISSPSWLSRSSLSTLIGKFNRATQKLTETLSSGSQERVSTPIPFKTYRETALSDDEESSKPTPNRSNPGTKNPTPSPTFETQTDDLP